MEVHELSASEEADKPPISVDYEATGRVRTVRRFATGDTFTTWCVDGVLAVRIKKADQLLHGGSDSAELFAKLAPAGQALHDAYPHSPMRGVAASAIGMAWDFDSKSQSPGVSRKKLPREPPASPWVGS